MQNQNKLIRLRDSSDFSPDGDAGFDWLVAESNRIAEIGDAAVP